MAEPIDFALDMMKRLTPQKVEDNLEKLLDLCPDLTDDLLSSIDQPLKIVEDTKAKKSFLICDSERPLALYRHRTGCERCSRVSTASFYGCV